MAQPWPLSAVDPQGSQNQSKSYMRTRTIRYVPAVVPEQRVLGVLPSTLLGVAGCSRGQNDGQKGTGFLRWQCRSLPFERFALCCPQILPATIVLKILLPVHGGHLGSDPDPNPPPLNLLGPVCGVGGGGWGVGEVLRGLGGAAGLGSQVPQYTYLKMIPSLH